MNKLRKAAEMIKGSQYPALKDDIYFKLVIIIFA